MLMPVRVMQVTLMQMLQLIIMRKQKRKMMIKKMVREAETQEPVTVLADHLLLEVKSLMTKYIDKTSVLFRWIVANFEMRSTTLEL